MTDETDSPEPGETNHRRRNMVLVLGGIALIVAIYFGPAIRQHAPDYYDPVRADLVKATLMIEDSLTHEQALIEHLKMAHEELDAAIARLTTVADMDPGHRSSVESLRASLRSMEDPDYIRNTSPEKLRQSYREILAQVDALIRSMDSRGKQ